MALSRRGMALSRRVASRPPGAHRTPACARRFGHLDRRLAVHRELEPPRTARRTDDASRRHRPRFLDKRAARDSRVRSALESGTSSRVRPPRGRRRISSAAGCPRGAARRDRCRSDPQHRRDVPSCRLGRLDPPSFSAYRARASRASRSARQVRKCFAFCCRNRDASSAGSAFGSAHAWRSLRQHGAGEREDLAAERGPELARVRTSQRSHGVVEHVVRELRLPDRLSETVPVPAWSSSGCGHDDSNMPAITTDSAGVMGFMLRLPGEQGRGSAACGLGALSGLAMRSAWRDAADDCAAGTGPAGGSVCQWSMRRWARSPKFDGQPRIASSSCHRVRMPVGWSATVARAARRAHGNFGRGW